MKNTVILLLLSISCFSSLKAQTFTPLVDGGDYACITFPDGTVKLGKANPDGYSLISEKKVLGNLNNRLTFVRGKTARLFDLKTEIREQGAQPNRDLVKALKAYKQAMKGQTVDEETKGYRSKEEQLDWINELISRLKTEQKSIKYQIKAAKNCDTIEPFVPAGSIKAEIVNAPNGVAAVLYGKDGQYYTVNNYCVRGNDGVIRVMNFQLSPCLLMNCVKPGYLGINLYNASADHTLSVDERAAFTADVLQHASGNYEVKIQKADKNYNLIPCEQILN